jgi:ubiquinone/menaquinone biosynthesis C-methylase UbiE
MDISIAALSAAESRSAGRHRFILHSAEKKFPLSDGGIGYVTCFDVLEHLRDPSGALAEIHRVLKPGGRALFHIPVKDHGWSMDWVFRKFRPANWQKTIDAAGHDYQYILTRKGYEEACARAGLKVIDMTEIGGITYFCAQKVTSSGDE